MWKVITFRAIYKKNYCQNLGENAPVSSQFCSKISGRSLSVYHTTEREHFPGYGMWKNSTFNGRLCGKRALSGIGYTESEHFQMQGMWQVNQNSQIYIHEITIKIENISWGKTRVGDYQFMKKARVLKSHATVPLKGFCHEILEILSGSLMVLKVSFSICTLI